MSTQMAGEQSAQVRIGTQGWNYPAWVGAQYPTGTRPANFLRLYSRAFGTVEVDSTFYAVPPASTVRGWVERTPPGFVFSLKLPREVTHERRLRGAEDVVDEFCDRAREMGERLGPILVQLGPDFGPDELPSLAAFLPRLPTDLRFAIEFRQHAWIRDDVLDLLRAHNVALALSDGKWMPRRTLLELVPRPTADFLYVRWMGPNRDITDYSRVQVDRTAELQAWADAVRPMLAHRWDVFGYVNNHFAGHSPASARELQRLLGQEPVEPVEIGEQTSLF